jgi:hypothetical protein
MYRRVDNSRLVSFTVCAWERVYATNLSRLQRETSKRHKREAHSVLTTAILLPQSLSCYWGKIVSLRMLTNLMLADLRLTTAQQRTIGQDLPSDLYGLPTYFHSAARSRIGRTKRFIDTASILWHIQPSGFFLPSLNKCKCCFSETHNVITFSALQIVVITFTIENAWGHWSLVFRICCEVVQELSGLFHCGKRVMSTRIIAPERDQRPETHASSGPHVIVSAYGDRWLPGAPKRRIAPTGHRVL